MKHGLTLIAWAAGVYAAFSWASGLLHSAGIAAAISAAAVVWWGYLRFSEENDRLIRLGREDVWERRDCESLNVFDVNAFDERHPW